MYRIIAGFRNYRVGRDGSIWSRCSGRWERLGTNPDANGYPTATLYRSSGTRHERQKVRVHTLVLAAFVGPCPDGMVTRHLDGKPWNNRLENLCYGTPAENAADAVRHGTHLRGEDCPTAKLTADEARQALWLYENVTRNRSEIARRLGIGRTSVCRILNGETWRHLAA
jgi:hypothetical protein